MYHFQHVKSHLETSCSSSGTAFHEGCFQQMRDVFNRYLVSAYSVLGIVLGARWGTKLQESGNFVNDVSPVPRIVSGAR